MSPRRLLPFLILAWLILSCQKHEPDELPLWTWSESLEFGRVPRWSPDGSRVLFGDDRLGRAGIWIWDISNSPVALAESLPPHNWDYRWSPNGRKVAFSSPAAPEDSLGGIWIVDIASAVPRKVWDRGRDVSWTRSDSALVFRISNPVAGSPGVYRLTLADSSLLLIADQGVKPLAQPGSNLIAFSDGEIDGRLLIIGGPGMFADIVSDPGASQWAWSSDGSSLCCVVNRYVSGTIRGSLFRITGAPPYRVDFLTTYASYPAPSGNGSKVAFARNAGASRYAIWLNEGGEDLQITEYGENPDFHPTADVLALNNAQGGIRILRRQ